jgi:ABC-type oligopeptide transport system substrate-binding subunit
MQAVDNEKSGWDLILLGMTNGFESYWSLRFMMCEQSWNKNFLGYCNPEFDKLVFEGKSNLNEKERRLALSKAARIWAEDLPRNELLGSQ